MPGKSKPKQGRALYDLRIAIRHIDPPIWRRVIVWWVTPLDHLHRVIQELFGWQDYHLYRFEIGDQEYEAPGPESTAEDSTEVSLGQLGLRTGDTFTYVYDFGDDWELEISILETPLINHETSYPYCVDGARAGPPEDSGGPHGYTQLLEILASPSHPDFREMTDWIGPGFQSDIFDLRATNRILALAFPAGAV
jgi:Plasmid pRiA4b ORF-3-like protein